VVDKKIQIRLTINIGTSDEVVAKST
jgi:hypothetical protein